MTDPRFDGAPLAMIRRVGRDALATRMIDLFLASGPTRSETIRTALEGGNLAEAGRAAHSLKSSAGQLGATALQGVCRHIEDAAREGDLATATSHLADFISEFAAAEAWLRAGAPTDDPPDTE